MKRLLVFAALATLANVAQAEEAAQNNAATSSSKTSVAVSGGQSAIALPKPEAKADDKIWTMSFVSLIESGPDSLHYSNNTDKSYKATNYVGIGYKVAEKTKVGLRQYVTYNHAAGKSTTTLNNPTLTLTQSMDGIFKSDAIAPMFWYYIPVSQAAKDVRSNGSLRMDLEVAWTLNPKWTVSYYLNPRQTLVPDGFTVDPATNESTPAFATTTYIQYANLYYNFNDSISAYTNVQMLDSWRTKDFTRSAENVTLGLGATFQIGNFNINPEVDMGVDTVKDFAKNYTGGAFFAEENLSYGVTAAYVF